MIHACPERPISFVIPSEHNIKIMNTKKNTQIVQPYLFGGKPNFQGVSRSLTGSDEADAERLFAGLAEDGKVTLPLTETFFSPRFGMIAGRFGVS